MDAQRTWSLFSSKSKKMAISSRLFIKKVSCCIKPASLGKVSDPVFIEKHLVPSPTKPCASDLLKHPFLVAPSPNLPSLQDSTDVISVALSDESTPTTTVQVSNSVALSDESSTPTTTVQGSNSNDLNSFTLTGNKEDDGSISMTLRIAGKSGRAKDVRFAFDLSTDTPPSVAAEMADALNLPNDDVVSIAGLMDDLINTLVGAPKSVLLSHCSKDDISARESPTLEITSTSCNAVTDAFCLLTTSTTPTEDDKCEELNKEIAAIDSYYQQLMDELIKKKAAAIEDAKRKWLSRKISPHA